MTDTRDDVPSLTLQVLQNIQAELVGLRREFKAENTSLREEIKAENAALRAERKSDNAALRRELSEGLTRLHTQLVELRGDMDIGFTALRLQNDRRFLDHERRLRDLEAHR